MPRYIWDEAKRARNLRERGLDFADADLVYENPDRITLDSPRSGEDRKQAIALVEVSGVILSLVYVERDADVRVISFRRASRVERSLYERAKESDRLGAGEA